MVGRLTVSTSTNYGDTFYATIITINGSDIQVEGLDVNDVNHRGAFNFAVGDNTELSWHNTPIELTDLEEGSRISVTFIGDVTETYPAGIHDVVKIVLLDD